MFRFLNYFDNSYKTFLRRMSNKYLLFVGLKNQGQTKAHHQVSKIVLKIDNTV